jgi:phenylalanyl-tRNA synthetase alpha chain
MNEPLSLTNLDSLEKAVRTELTAIGDAATAEAFRIKYLGKKGALRSLLKGLGSLPEDERRNVGARVNSLYDAIESSFNGGSWNNTAQEAQDSTFDWTLPARPIPTGSIHPLTTIRNEICNILIRMGFDVATGPEVETDWYNFEALNFPPHHPARDMQDTFFVSAKTLLRTHTSPVQIRVMEGHKPPIRSIMPGRVYRNEEISSRSNCFFSQVEGLFVDKNVSMVDLKSTLLAFSREFFDEKTRIKIRGSFFPFTEPSIEADVECFLCKGKGCSVCKQSGWLEVLGAGMVHPNVLRSSGIDPEVYTGFAFGIGVERIALLKYGVDDIRLFFENDVRFLEQF